MHMCMHQHTHGLSTHVHANIYCTYIDLQCLQEKKTPKSNPEFQYVLFYNIFLFKFHFLNFNYQIIDSLLAYFITD